jgi:hypothetical protein
MSARAMFHVKPILAERGCHAGGQASPRAALRRMFHVKHRGPGKTKMNVAKTANRNGGFLQTFTLDADKN